MWLRYQNDVLIPLVICMWKLHLIYTRAVIWPSCLVCTQVQLILAWKLACTETWVWFLLSFTETAMTIFAESCFPGLSQLRYISMKRTALSAKNLQLPVMFSYLAALIYVWCSVTDHVVDHFVLYILFTACLYMIGDVTALLLQIDILECLQFWATGFILNAANFAS